MSDITAGLFDQMSPVDWLIYAYEVAVNSPDDSTQNGAVLISGNKAVRDCNRFPPGVPCTLRPKATKYKNIGHAEGNTIHLAAKQGIVCGGSVLVCPWFACRDCAKDIIMSGVKRVIGHKERMDIHHEVWADEISEAWKWMADAGVVCELISAKIGCPSILVHGERWEP